jgi:hypothetical protein
MIELSEQQIIDELVARLEQKFPTVEPTTVANLVHALHADFDGRPIRDYVPLFVERKAHQELATLLL